MIHDEDLHSAVDYSQDQIDAAHRVLVELTNLFDTYKDDICIVGGWVPDLMFPDKGHVGSVDVDVLINHLKLKDAGYQTMARLLLRNGYQEHPEKYFSFIKSVEVHGIKYDVDVDILAGMYGGTKKEKRSQHVQGMTALKTTGGNFAFEFPTQHIKVEAQRPDGAIDVVHVNVVAVVPYIVMKTSALGRGKAKDAYDIYFVVKHYLGGVRQLAKELAACSDKQIIQVMKAKLAEKFASPEHSGPADVANFMDLPIGEEREIICRDAFEQIRVLLSLI